MPTLVEVSGAAYPQQFKSKSIPPLEGRSLLPIFAGREQSGRAPLFWEHEGNRAVHFGQWKLVSRYPGPWELYDTDADRTELFNLAAVYPEKVVELSDLYQRWAERCGVVTPGQLPPPKKIIPAAVGVSAD